MTHQTIAALLCATATVSAAELDDGFLDGLRQRRQFSLAASFCESELARLRDAPETDSVRLAALTAHLVRVRAEQALHAAPEDREQHWNQSQAVATTFLDRYAEHPRGMLVRLQAALANLARGELNRREAELAVDKEQMLQTARTILRQAARQFDEIERELVQMIAQRHRASDNQHALTAEELRSLKWQAQYDRSRVLRNQALCYAAGSPDRIAALTQALEYVQAPLREISESDPLAQQMRLAHATCQRHIGDFEAAQLTLQSLAEGELPSELAVAREAEQLRLHIARGNLKEALDRLTQRQTALGSSADFDFAQLEVYVALWQNSGRQSDSPDASWRDKAVATAELIERSHGPYWARRADLALVRAGQNRGSGSLPILLRTAADLYTRGQLSEAVVVYDKAANASRRAGDAVSAFDSAYRAAAVQQQRMLFADASERFRTLALANRDDSRAAGAHLVAAVNAAEAVRRGDLALSEYRDLLDEHTAIWPESQTASTAAMWRSQIHAQQAEWKEAVQVLRAVVDRKSTDPSRTFSAAVESLGSYWLRWLDAAPAEQRPVLSADAMRFFDQLVSVDPGTATAHEGDELSRAMCVAACTSAQLRLRHAPNEAAIAEQQIQRAFARPPDDERLEFRAKLLVSLLVGLQPGRGEEARRTLNEVTFSDRSQAVWTFDTLQALARRRPLDNLSRWAVLQQAVAERLLADGQWLTPAQRIEIALLRSRALAVVDTPAALAVLKDLAARHADQPAVQDAYAEMLLATDQAETLQQALAAWRRIAAGAAPRTERWYQAKFSVASALFRLGQPSDAAKLIRYLQLTEDLEAAGYAERFAQLLKQCEQ